MPVEQKKGCWVLSEILSYWSVSGLEFLFFYSSFYNKKHQGAVAAWYFKRIKCYIKWEGKITMINQQNLSKHVSALEFRNSSIKKKLLMRGLSL